MTELTPHFSLEELTRSEAAARLGIDNTPPVELLPVITGTAQRMEDVRMLFGAPINVHSGYRNTATNHLVGGVPTSAHLSGHAVDFEVVGWDNVEAAERIAGSSIRFDQLILEYGWIHISFDPAMRGQVMTKKSASLPYVAGIAA